MMMDRGSMLTDGTSRLVRVSANARESSTRRWCSPRWMDRGMTLIFLAAASVSSVPMCDSRDEIFVVGCGHSGTTIMLRLIGNHPDIHYTPQETCALCRIGAGITEGEDKENEWKRSTQRLAKIDAAAAEAGSRRWVEKTPIHVRYLEKLFLLRPRAKVIMMIRDGRDVVSSFKGRVRPENAAAGVRNGAMRWVQDTSAGLKFKNHPQVHTVRYEDFALYPKDVMAKVFRFLDEEFDSAVIFAEQNTSFNGISSASVKEKPADEAANHEELRAYQVSHGLFDGRGRWLEPLPRGLDARERAYVHDVCGNLLADLRYASDGSWV